MATALFVCLHNAGRSQMSAALFERASGGRHRALSAGSVADPEGRVHPEVVAVMAELGIDVDWELPDPKGLPVGEVSAIRDDIAGRVERLVAELDG